MFKILKYSQQLILENVQQAKQLLAKLNIELNNPNYLAIRKMLSGNDGYTFWFVKQHFQNNITLEDLKSIWDICQNDKGTIAKFKTPVVKLDTVENFWDEYYSQKNLSKARSAYNKFLPEQRRLLDFNNQEDRDLLEELSKIENADEYFFNKSKRYHTRNNLISAIKTFLSGTTSSDFDALLEQLKKDNQDIRYESKYEDIIITCVDYPSIRKWGSDTSWCIVGSKGTFDSYNSSPFSQQFIIFLTDEKGNMSKIGVTTSINGYLTAHLKNDSYCPKEKLVEILSERGTNFGLLLPSKEQVSEIKNWNNFAVKDLLDIGFTKEEIVSKKSRFNSGNTRNDLSNFTSEEIEKWSLLDKTTLYPQDLVSFSPKEIESRQLWKRMEIMSISDLKDLKLDYKLLRKIAIENDGKNDFLTSFISNTRDRRSALSKLKNYLSYTKDGRTTSDGFIDRHIRNQNKINLFDLLRPSEEEFSTENLLSLFIDLYDEKRNIEFVSNVVGQIKKRDRSLTDEQFGKLLSHAMSYRDKILIYSKAISENLHKEWCLSKIKKTIEDASITDRWRDELRNFEINSSDLKQIRSNLNDEELFNQIKDKSKLYYSKNPRALRLKDDGRRYDGVNFRETINNIDFLNLKLNIEDFGIIFSSDGVSLVDDIIDYFKKNNYDLSDESKLVEMSKKIKNHHDSEIEFYSQLIKCGVDVDNSYNELLDWVKSQRAPLSTYDKKSLEELFNKQEVYYKKWKDLHKLDEINEALSDLLRAAGEYWTRGTKIEPENWFQKHWNTIKDISWSDLTSSHKDYDQKYFISLLVLLAKLKKTDELNTLDNPKFIQGERYDNSGLRTTCKIIADKSVINSRKSHTELTFEERKVLYDWVSKKVEQKLAENPEEYKNIKWIMNIGYYLFDKTKFWKNVDEALSSRNNFEVTDWSTGEVKSRTTLRVWGILTALKFLAQESYWSDFEKILQKLSELKMSKKEYQSTIDDLKRASFYNARSESDREKGEVSSSREFRNESEKKYKELLDKYIKEPVGRVKKVLDWYQFNNK